MTSETPVFVVLLQDGDSSAKLRFRETDLVDSPSPYSGEDLATAIRARSRHDIGSTTIDVYDSKTETFIPLDMQTDVRRELGSRLRCSIRRREEQTDTLAIQGRFFPYDNGMMVAKTRLVVREMPNIAGAGTGLNVWDGAVLLVKYLEQMVELVREKKVLELGAGCGLVGIAASLLGAKKAVLTDLPYTMELMKGNISSNQQLGSIDCRVCDWFDNPVFDKSWEFDVLLIADCVWVEELVMPLLSTMRRLLESSSGFIQVVVSYQRRGKVAHDLFWAGMRNMFETIETVDSLSEKPEQLNIYKCSTRC